MTPRATFRCAICREPIARTRSGLTHKSSKPKTFGHTPVPPNQRGALPSFFNPDGTTKSGVQRLYRWGDWGLSLVNHPALHGFPFAWEAAVIRFTSQDNNHFTLDYSTTLTEGVEIFSTDEDAEAFIQKARAYFLQHPVNMS